MIDFTGAYGERSLPVLRPGGMLVSVPSGVPQELLDRPSASERRATGFLVEPDPVGLAGLCHLVEDGQLQVRVDRVFDLEESPRPTARRKITTAAARSSCASPSRHGSPEKNILGDEPGSLHADPRQERRRPAAAQPALPPLAGGSPFPCAREFLRTLLDQEDVDLALQRRRVLMEVHLDVVDVRRERERRAQQAKHHKP